jgi:hypothetical protein
LLITNIIINANFKITTVKVIIRNQKRYEKEVDEKIEKEA